MRHAAVCAASLALVLLMAVLLDAVAARSDKPGVVWVVTRGPAGPALSGLVRGGGASVDGTWAHGRLVQLRVDSLRDAVRQGAAWAVWRMPQTDWGWPGCG